MAPQPDSNGKLFAPLTAWAAAVRRLRGRLGAHRDELALRSQSRSRPAPRAALRSGPVVVSGLIHDARGIGQAARATIAALRRDGVEVIQHDAAPYLGGESPAWIGPVPDGGVWIIHLNPEEMRRLLRLCPELARAPMLRIGFWFWELPEAPSPWLEAGRYVLEIWCASSFTAKSFAAQSYAPVRTLPHPFGSPLNVASDRARFALREDQIVFLTFADARSSLARKNPVAALRAFRAAFKPDDTGVALIVKISGDASHDDVLEALRASAEGAANIFFLREDMDETGVASLMESADVIVSLHRAESLGLVVAEGMARGKAVLTTPWSGVADFIAPDCVASVDFELAPVRDPQGVYPPGQVWAEPSERSAAAWMIRLRGDAALRAEMGARARARAAACLPAMWPREALGETFLRCARREGLQ